jgi:SAM-dependent methyltransferase
MGNSVISFRDPDGRVVSKDGRVLRFVRQTGGETFLKFTQTDLASELFQEGKVIGTTRIDRQEAMSFLPAAGLFETAYIWEHDPIPFPSYPHEWAPEMLGAAGELTLELALRLQTMGWGLKDATPYNILFRGPSPVFIDVLSLEERSPYDPLWKAAAQFERTFILPLIAYRYFGLSSANIFLEYRDGIEPESLYRLCGPIRRLSPLTMRFITLPVWLGRRQKPGGKNLYRSRLQSNAPQAQFSLRLMIRGLQRHLAKLRKGCVKTGHWSNYIQRNTYSEGEFSLKNRYVADTVKKYSPSKVLDVGCNTGEFSLLAARSGAEVVAIDSDLAVISSTYRKAMEHHSKILPLAVNFARPTPALGWDNAETRTFLDRAYGYFDAVLMLGILHHLMVTERLPVSEILALANRLTKKWVLIEYVGKEDPMFLHLARGRETLYEDWTLDFFQSCCRQCFDVVEAVRLGESHRWLFLLLKR